MKSQRVKGVRELEGSDHLPFCRYFVGGTKQGEQAIRDLHRGPLGTFEPP